MKKKVKILDYAFAHCNYSNNPTPPIQSCEWIEWDRSEPNQGETLFATENHITNSKFINHVGRRIAWLLESREFNPQLYEWVKTNHHLFDFIITHDRKLIDSIPNAKWAPTGGCWVYSNDWIIYEKTKLVSIVASDKNLLVGHKMRHQIINLHREKIDLFGKGYNPIQYKIESLKNYKYQIVIENASVRGYFTEKLIDAFVTGTIPIYFGDPDIEEIFDSSGMIIVDSLESLDYVLKDLEKIDISQFQKGIKKNFEIAKQYILTENYIQQNYPEIYE